MNEPKVVILLLALMGCPGCEDEGTPPPPGYQRTIALAVEDVGTTDAWLRVRLADAPPYGFRLLRDGQTVLNVSTSPGDTLVGDEPLLPKRSYTYKAYRLSGTRVTDSSEAVQVTTMDTTSSAWQWALDTLGVMNSYLVDCAIIAPDNIWVVGEIYARDSLGNVENIPHNAARWNGQRWELKRIPFIGPCSAVDYPPLNAIWAFSETNILVTNGGSIVRYDGRNAVMDCGMNSLLAGSINKIYATSPQDVYLVGNAGTIAHYDGLRWRRVESGTGLPIVDIHGVRSTKGEYEILAVADGYDRPEGSYVLSITNNTVQQVWHDPRPYGLDEIWFVPSRQYIVVGSGVWKSYSAAPGSSWSWVSGLPPIHSTCIRGQALNDIFVGGAFWNLMHFNGTTWRSYFPFASGSFTSVAMKGNVAIAVGGSSNRAIVVQGRR
jgi:hypothetical protein